MSRLLTASLATLGLAVAAAQPARAADLNINDAGSDPNIVFSENDFENGFSLNGVQVQIGLGNPKSQTVSENGTFVDGAAENTFSGSWTVFTPVVPVNETIFFTECGPHGITEISDVLHVVYSSDGARAQISGYVISDNEAHPLTVADLNAVGIVATSTMAETSAPFVFGNQNISASLQSDVETVPEASTWAMMLLGFAGLGFAAVRRGARARLVAG